MLSVSRLRGVSVRSAGGAALGVVSGVLFHPSEARVVGLCVERPRLVGVIRRRERYVPLREVSVQDGAIVLTGKALPSDASGERMIGCSWEGTVHWQGMPVRDAGGQPAGAVADASFDSDGRVHGINLSTGVLGDVAVGRLTVPGEALGGFDGEAVRLTTRVSELASDGGVAKAAAAAVTVAKDAGAAVARKASDATLKAAGAVGRSLRSGAARRMLDGIKQAMGEDPDAKE